MERRGKLLPLRPAGKVSDLAVFYSAFAEHKELHSIQCNGKASTVTGKVGLNYFMDGFQ